MIPFMEIFRMKKEKKIKQESAQDICKKFLKTAIVDETKIGTKKFREDLYDKLIAFGVWNTYDFCKKLDEDAFIAHAGYKKQSDIKKVFEIQSAVKEKHFK